MLTEVSDSARYAPLVQIARRGAHQQRAICQTPGLQGTVLESADAHGHVPATIEQVDLTVGQAQLHLYRRMAAAEFGDQRGDELRAEGQGTFIRSSPVASTRWEATLASASSISGRMRWQASR